jgi:hypothetical protein
LEERGEFEYEEKEYANSNELTDPTDNEETFRRYISLDESDRQIKQEGYEVRKSEEYSDEYDVFE